MKSKAQEKFEEERKDLSEKELLMEILYSNFLSYRTMERVRSNTSTIATIVILWAVFTVIVGVLAFFALNK